MGLLYYGQAITRIKKLKNGWSEVSYKNHIAFIKSKYLSNTRPKEKLGKYRLYSAPSGYHQKSYMDWKMTTDKTSPQYKFLQKCYIAKNGILKYKYRYCVALGSYYCKKIGTKFDLILNNGTVIKCILAEQKDDKDTDSTNRYHTGDGSIAEFIVSTRNLNRKTRLHGDCSYSGKGWNSEIKYIKIYQ